ncbi:MULTISPECIES: FadR/GntR family transcriptional regulator [Actinomyces]|uniref:FadR family transcriptional regulator n=1 Tax=Actinomyces respiraculi TaxID=2744574 RepID=A0A7T0PWR5_9ACTO|nr:MULTISPECIES: FCD domain-containing protein [Actinomyces]QPL04840.1 FadR family transcriptional regulator [Actinomyces respiraculi]
MANDLVEGAVEGVLDAIVDRTFVEEEPLPAEAELARFLRVSRPTMREAVRNLSMGGVLNVVHGRGTFLLPRFRWRELRYLMYVAAHEGRVREVELDLIGVEEMLEVGAVRLAARQRSEADLDEMRRCLEEYKIAAKTDDIQALVGLDHAFHDVILGATGNQFVASTMHPFRDALLGARFRATESGEVRVKVISQHRRILEAVEAQDAERAAELMHEHMAQMRKDLLTARERRGGELSENL